VTDIRQLIQWAAAHLVIYMEYMIYMSRLKNSLNPGDWEREPGCRRLDAGGWGAEMPEPGGRRSGTLMELECHTE